VEDASVGSSAYLANTIDGTTNEFLVSSSGSHARTTPTIAVGGGSGTTPYVAFGWVDESSGIVTRRFPAP
jgi:hypothetical protein